MPLGKVVELVVVVIVDYRHMAQMSTVQMVRLLLLVKSLLLVWHFSDSS